MDYMFEDDLFEVGAEVDAYCTRCKTDTPHTVVTKYEDVRYVLKTAEIGARLLAQARNLSSAVGEVQT